MPEFDAMDIQELQATIEDMQGRIDQLFALVSGQTSSISSNDGRIEILESFH
jgi:hypothetical protein